MRSLPAPQRPAGKWGAGGFSFSWCDEARALEHILRTLAGKDDRNDFRVADLAIYGQESNNTTWRLCKMNLAIRGIDSITTSTKTSRPTSFIPRRALIREGICWSGDLDDVEFLNRLYDLASLPSTDGRFENAEGDIWQHRINNLDWDDNPMDETIEKARMSQLQCCGKFAPVRQGECEWICIDLA